MYSTDNQIDYTLQAILKADAVAKYSYKNGTRVKKGTFYKDANGIERFKPISDFSHIGEEPWPLKYSRFYSKELLKIDNSGHKKIQNLRTILFNIILSNKMEKAEFLRFYKLLKDLYTSKEFPEQLKTTMANELDMSTNDLYILEQQIYHEVVKDERPLLKHCELKLAGDSYLAPYSKYCSEYVRDIKVENLIVGNTYPDVEKSVQKLSLLLQEYLTIKLRNIKLESERKAFLLDTKLINKKFKDLIQITMKNTARFMDKLLVRYKVQLLKQSNNDEIKLQARTGQLKENFEVVSYNIWRYLTKEWMQKELLRYFDQHLDKLMWLSDGYLSSEMLINQGDVMKKYMQMRVKIGVDKKKKVRTLTPVNSDEFYPGVNTGIDL